QHDAERGMAQASDTRPHVRRLGRRAAWLPRDRSETLHLAAACFTSRELGVAGDDSQSPTAQPLRSKESRIWARKIRALVPDPSGNLSPLRRRRRMRLEPSRSNLLVF